VAKYDPNFWEISVDPKILESALTEPDFLARLLTAQDEDAAAAKADAMAAAMGQIRAIISTRLTAQQRRIVELYFFENKTQQEIAAELGINQQVVSKHLFGAMRGSEKVGGAIKKLKKLCLRSGIDPKKWV
jgi:RNA polymerase sigma factor (sigma-70 family)